MNTINKLMVGKRGENVDVGRLGVALTREEAINLAAWLAALTDLEQVIALVEEIEETESLVDI